MEKIRIRDKHPGSATLLKMRLKIKALLWAGLFEERFRHPPPLPPPPTPSRCRWSPPSPSRRWWTGSPAWVDWVWTGSLLLIRGGTVAIRPEY